MKLQTARGTVGFEESGSGLPVVLLHGFPHDRTLWAAQLAAAPAGARMIALDLPGFGESDSAEVPSLDHWADWVVAALDALAIERAVIGGLSMGGYLAFALWRRHPQRILGLILADTRAGADTLEGQEKRVAMQAQVLKEGPGAIAAAMLPGMVGKTTRAERPRAVEYLDAMMRRASVEAIHDALDALRTRPDSTPTLATITVPTLIICGEEDVLTPVKESEAMHAAIADAQLALIPGAGHASCVEHPSAFNALLSGFVQARFP
ncbi:alpha/beta fold hydrolase [Pseudogemmatithrix spongiicola]|uniref:Alpha/beta fold hydrolase n=1 Tax=Pseudogemmatithrix spongiicola TaxID=3062599 RepID=A0AA49K260_9BACT|nr:alpha/beta fold hydrolase [Gemmatimonadaceae bacterium 'strain 138']WKW16336.1 alpha/beta fold hydrolase [Gemmatimonadaceae bacterium 'strain 318']